MNKLPTIILLTAVLVQSATIIFQGKTINRLTNVLKTYEQAFKDCVVKP